MRRSAGGLAVQAKIAVNIKSVRRYSFREGAITATVESAVSLATLKKSREEHSVRLIDRGEPRGGFNGGAGLRE